MSHYHPDADPDFVAMHSHYEALSTSHFQQALHTAFDSIAYLTLDSEKADFCYSLWKQGYKIVPVTTGRTLPDLERERLVWSLETFTEATSISSLRKLEGEIREVEADLLSGNDPTEEYADCLMCLLDSAGRAGLTVDQLTQAFAQKLAVNKQRVWRKNDDNSYSHTVDSTVSGTDISCEAPSSDNEHLPD